MRQDIAFDQRRAAAHRTNVDGVWIRPNQARSLKKGSVFRLGGSTREFKVRPTTRV